MMETQTAKSPERKTITPCFIVGMPRSGTTWLLRSLNTHHQIAAFGETAYWGRNYIHPNADGKYDAMHLNQVASILKKNFMDTIMGKNEPGYLKNLQPDDMPGLVDRAFTALKTPVTPGEVFLSFAKEIAQAEGKYRWVEKTPHHINWIDRILSELPESRFVVTLREPYTFMLSYKNQKGWEARSGEMYKKLYHPFGCAQVYKVYARQAFQIAQDYRGKVLIVRLEEIIEKKRQILKNIQKFFLLEYEPELEGIQSRVFSSSQFSSQINLSGEDLFWMNQIARSAVTDLEYEILPVKYSVSNFLKIAFSFIQFLIWAPRAFLLMNKRIKSNTIKYLWRWIIPGKMKIMR